MVSMKTSPLSYDRILKAGETFIVRLTKSITVFTESHDSWWVNEYSWLRARRGIVSGKTRPKVTVLDSAKIHKNITFYKVQVGDLVGYVSQYEVQFMAEKAG